MLHNVHSSIVMVKILQNNPINICRHVIDQQIHVNAWNYECEMDFQ
jgi:hypothetical protein